MTIDQMLRNMHGRVSFHMPGNKMRFGDGSAWDVTELGMTDNLHHPEGPYLELGRRLAERNGAAISFPLVGGSTRGMQLMILYAARGGEMILARNAHLSAWSACVLGGIRPIPVDPVWDEEMKLTDIRAEDVCCAIEQHPSAKAVLMTRPDFYGRMTDIRKVVETAHAHGMKVLIDEAHGAHFPWAGLTSAGDLGADFWMQSLHKTLPALTPCAALNAADAKCESEIRRLQRMIETSSPSSMLLRSSEECVDYMESIGAHQLKKLEEMCAELRGELSADERFAMTEEFYARYPVDPARLVIDVRGTGLTGFEVSDRLAEQGVDVEMADFCRIVGIPSVMTTQADMDALKKAMLELPHGKAPKVEAPGLHYGVRAAWPREAAFGQTAYVKLENAVGAIAAESIGIYPPGIPLCVPGEIIGQNVIDAMCAAQKAGGSLFGMNDEGEVAVAVRRYDVVIFDLDGTLMDTSDGVIRSVQYALEQVGYPSDDLNRIRKFIGPPLHAAFKEYYGMDDAMAEEAVRQYRVRYQSIGVYEYTPYPGMKELIRDLYAAGVHVAVATGKPEKFSRLILEREGLMDCVEMLVTPSLQDTKDNKPDMIRQIVEKLGRNAAMVGDRRFDMEGARANGVDGLGVTQGFGGAEELEQSGAAFVVRGSDELRRLLL